jgi:hypothetical protein
MSYLNALRLHFSGQFQANVSTVNNDPGHFDNGAFLPSYQDMQGPNMQPPNGWFNPQGDAAFRLLGCTITTAWTPSGQVGSSDPVLGYIIADSDDRVPAKLVDLDPEQQMVSTIWGLKVRIADAGGNTLVQGNFKPAAFIDLWIRAGGGGGDAPMGAMWQSVLTNLQWGNVSASPFLTALQQASAATGRLSIKFDLDGINMDYSSPDFMCGRIVGTIGPALEGEPAHLIIGRQFMTNVYTNNEGLGPIPTDGINFFVGAVESAAGGIFLDLGNALPTTIPGGPLSNLGDLSLIVPSSSGSPVTLGTVAASVYTDPAWYANTAGVVLLPLTTDQLQLVAAAPLTLQRPDGKSISEWGSGAFVRADEFVYRMSPGDSAEIPVYAMQWGAPLAGVGVGFALDPSQLQPGAPPDIVYGPPVATPNILTFSAIATTDSNGVAILKVAAGDPGNVRWFNNGTDYGIDGQVYGVRPGFADPSLTAGAINNSNFISFLVWSGFTASYPQTWAELKPIFQQFANLYPVMNRFLNLADYESVVAHTRLLKLAFALDPDDPNAMPVTRDLSPAKRNAILAWLDNPLFGAPSPVRAPTPAAQAIPAAGVVVPSSRGGKSAAYARRLVLRTQ